ncbi:MAG: CBS domain-containing protein [Bacteroidetes bacterium]|nr:CBS domain-containing protein [Bacteroidota bacterium]
MLVSEFIQSSIPTLSLTDTISVAIDLMQQNNLNHIAVVQNDNYEGLLNMDDLLDAADDKLAISHLSGKFSHLAIRNNQHLLTALKLVSESGVSVLPVLTDNMEYSGVVTEKTLIQHLNIFLNTEVPGGLFVLEMPMQKFSIGEICRLVETNDAYVTQFNTYTEQVSGLFIVTFKINKSEISDVLATLQRYDYTIRYYFGDEFFENSLKENFENLMSYLNV